MNCWSRTGGFREVQCYSVMPHCGCLATAEFFPDTIGDRCAWLFNCGAYIEPYWGLSRLRTVQHADGICAISTWRQALLSPGIIWSTAFLASSSDGVEEVGFWDGSGLRSYWMSQCGSCYWMSVCFWDAGNPFTLTASSSCWLAIWTLWKTAEQRGLKIQIFPACGGSVHLWVSVGQMIPITVPWWRLGVDSCSGDLYQLARRKGAFTEMLLQRALAGKPFLNVPLPGNVISQVLQNSSNRPLCRVYRPNVYPAEVRF